MKKFQLNLEDLTVETFSASEGGRAELGTVKANEAQPPYTYTCGTCGEETCETGDTEVYHCNYTHLEWDFGSCVAASCLDSCDTFCGWVETCYSCYDSCRVCGGA